METLANRTKPAPRIRWQTLLMATILLSILSRVLLVLFPLYEERWKFIFNLACVALAGPVLGMTDVGKQSGMRILIAAFLWIICVCLLHFSEYRDPELLMTYVLMAAVSLLLAYPAAFVLPAGNGRRLFRMAALLYIVCITALSITVLSAAFRGVYLPSPGGPDALGAGVFIEPLERRMHMFCNPIEGGLYCAIALVLLLLILPDTKGRACRAALFAAGGVLFSMLALSDARTPGWALCACAGGAAYLFTGMRNTKGSPFLRFCIAAAAAVAAAGACFALLRITAHLLNPLIPHLDDLRAANLDAGNLSGRTEVWASAVRMLKENPSVFWTGAGPMRGMPLVQSYFTFDDTVLAHPHSIVLSIWITLGLPGLLLFAGFAAYAGYHSVRLFFRPDPRRTFSERALPLLLAFCLIVDLIETFLSFSGAGDHSNLWFFLTAGYVVSLSAASPSSGGAADTRAKANGLRR